MKILLNNGFGKYLKMIGGVNRDCSSYILQQVIKKIFFIKIIFKI
jgi:hypothetical protein